MYAYNRFSIYLFIVNFMIYNSNSKSGLLLTTNFVSLWAVKDHQVTNELNLKGKIREI